MVPYDTYLVCTPVASSTLQFYRAMARFSVSPPTSSSNLRQQQQQSSSLPNSTTTTAAPQWKWTFPPRKFHMDDDDFDDDDDSSSSSSSSSEEEEDEDVDSYSYINNEPPHPLGFESRYGTTCFGLSRHHHHRQQHGETDSENHPRTNDAQLFDDDDDYAWNALIQINDNDNEYYTKTNGRIPSQQSSSSFFSPNRTYHLENRGGVSTKMLLRGMMIMMHQHSHSDGGGGGDLHDTTMDELSMGMDRIANLVKAAKCCHDPSEGITSSLITPRTYDNHQPQQQSPSNACLSSPSTHTTIATIPPPRSTSRLLQLAMECERHQHDILSSNDLVSSQLQSSSEKMHQQQHCQGFLLLLQAEEDRVRLAKERIAQRQERAHKLEEMGRLEHESLERQLREQRQEQERMESERIAVEAARSQEEHEKERHRLELLAIAEQEAEEEAAAKNRHLSRAHDLIMHLDRVRSGGGGLWEFDKSTMVSKRRLQFKKIVNGKINTLAHDGGKILEVSRLVCDSISNAAKDDNDMAADNTVGGGVTTMGKNYLLDLLCSNLIVRVQADGFNGTRGDGFPLAGMFAQVSVQCEEICPVLEGHLYTVCRMAIPAFSLDNTGADKKNENNNSNNDDFLMESLGMIRDKNGEFESFEKFLHRTEGLISIMADTMSSLPANHTLLGGHEGALVWLQRFMDLLPPPPVSPLPLLTAPVLVAFLTGAGHMLARTYPSEFTPLLSVMKDDVLHRLDETPIGVPSATRLKKVLEDIGFEGLRRDLPQGAVAGLYNNIESSGGGSRLSGFTVTHSQGLSSSLSPFDQESSGDAVSSLDVAFDASSAPSTASVNNNNNNMSEEGAVASPLGIGLFGSSTAAPFGGQQSFFGSISAASPTPSPFGQSSGLGGTAGAFASNQAGGGVPSSGFMPASTTKSSTFGSFVAAAPVTFTSFPPSFGMVATTNPSPFGATSFGTAPSSAASAFGSSAPTPSPFGIGDPAPNPSPFGTASSTFATAPGPSPFSSAPFGSSPFGGSTITPAQGSSPFSMSSSGGQGFGQSGEGGDTAKQLCKFFASGSCNFGDRCKFSHELGAGKAGGSSSNMSPFGMSSGRQLTNTFSSGGNKPPCKFFASGSCRNGNSCQFSHSSTPFGSGGFGQSNNPSPFTGGASSGGGFGSFGLGAAANPSPFSSTGASNNPFGGPRR